MQRSARVWLTGAMGGEAEVRTRARNDMNDPMSEVECASQQSRMIADQLLDHLVGAELDRR